MQLQNKVALVTGAGRGMGKAIALALAQEGAQVSVADIDGEAVEETSIAVREMGTRSIALQADVGSLPEIDRMVKDTVDGLGRIDILVNNAGITRFLNIMDITEQDWDSFHRVNAKGAFFCMQRVARELIQQGEGGRVINIASIAGKGYSGTSNAAYAASKGAVRILTKSTAIQYAGDGIRCNSVHPGVIESPMTAPIMLDTVEGRAQAAARHPLGRIGQPEDIAYGVLFLASDESSFMTGSELVIDGGLTAQ